MSAARSRIATRFPTAAVLLVLLTVGTPGAALAGLESRISTPEPINPGDIAVGADGNLWFPETGTNRIGRMTIAEQVGEFTIPDAAALGHVIAPGPDGRIWVLGSGLDGLVHVWAVDTSGLSVEIASPGESRAL